MLTEQQERLDAALRSPRGSNYWLKTVSKSGYESVYIGFEDGQYTIMHQAPGKGGHVTTPHKADAWRYYIGIARRIRGAEYLERFCGMVVPAETIAGGAKCKNS